MRNFLIFSFKTTWRAFLERFWKPETVVTARSAWIGSMSDSIKIVSDIISPANEESDWEALRN